MRMKKLLVALVMLAITAGSASAQEEEERSDRVESMKIAFITEKLHLTSAEAQTFWPVFNEFSAELKKSRAKQRENVQGFKAKANPTDQESNRFITDQLAQKQAELDLTKRYVNEFKKVLPEKKVALLLTLEQDFKQQLLQRLKNRQGKMQR